MIVQIRDTVPAGIAKYLRDYYLDHIGLTLPIDELGEFLRALDDWREELANIEQRFLDTRGATSGSQG